MQNGNTFYLDDGSFIFKILFYPIYIDLMEPHSIKEVLQ
jgi:hypothetical protein